MLLLFIILLLSKVRDNNLVGKAKKKEPNEHQNS